MRALVLSAGGMFGAWQAGAWTALSGRFRPDAIAGASAGALNGWMIAGGATPAEIAGHWLDASMAGIMQARVPWVPWRGVFNPRRLERLVRDLFDAYRPRVPFAAVLVEVPRLLPVLVRGEEMTWRHLLATCAIPMGFPAVAIDGRRYVDGGLLGALPLWAAARLGATAALALDALPRMPSRLVRGVVGGARRVAGPAPGPPPAEVAYLAPSRRLGGVRDAVTWDEARVRNWLALGARDGAALLASATPVCRAVFD